MPLGTTMYSDCGDSRELPVNTNKLLISFSRRYEFQCAFQFSRCDLK